MAKRLARKAERDWPAGRPQDAALTTMSESAAFVKPQFVVLGSVISEYRSLGPSQGRPDPRVGRDTDKRDESRSQRGIMVGGNVVMPTCDQIREAVNKYEAENPTEDCALKQALDSAQSLPRSFGRFLAEVCLIADWGTIQLFHFSFDERAAMAREIETSGSVLQAMRTSHLEGWADTAGTKRLIDAVDRLSQTELLRPPGTKKRQLSFLSKYLHWCVNDAFPIWDSNARRALNVVNNDASWSSYKDWLIRVREELAKHGACCLKYGHLRSRECPLRTLDKALYVIGRR